MTKFIAPILCLGLILCMGTVPSSAVVADSGLWGQHGSGNSGNLIVLSSDTFERIERPTVYGNTSREDGIENPEVEEAATPEKGAIQSPPATASEKPLYKPGSIIVRFKQDAADSPYQSTRAADAAHSRIGSTVTIDYSDVGLPGMQMLQLPEEISIAEAVKTYSQNPDVLYAEPNYYYYADTVPGGPQYHDLSAPAPMSGDGGGSGSISVPNDPEFGNLWGLHNTGQTIMGITGTAGADIDAPEAWSITRGSRDVIVAVIDSGVMYTHPDLAANIWTNSGEIPDNGVDDDDNGYIDDVYGWDFYGDDNDPGDFYGHGTHCAGTIAAVGNNSLGVTGVMWNAQVMPLRFLDQDGRGATSDAVLAIQYATMMGADVISCSWGGSGSSQALKDAIDATPALVVCAAGNEALNNDVNPHYPSSYNSENILAVAASTNTERLASFSHFGATSVDVAAPGARILSTCVTLNKVTAFSDSMDSLDAWDANATWGLNTVYYTSPPSAADDSPAGSYSANTNAWLTTKDPVDLGGLKGTMLIFSTRWDLETDHDHLLVISSSDGVVYYIRGFLTGSSGGDWYQFGVPLDMYDGGPVYIGFALSTDESVQKSGVFIDDVYVVGVKSSSADYAYYSGTSMATPHVSGVAGLVLSINASLSATEVKDIIISTVDLKPVYAGKMVSGGRVNAYGAVSAVVPAAGQPLSIVSNKDSVVRGNCFVVTVSGELSKPYWVYVKDAAIPAGEYPLISPGQMGVTPGVEMTGITDAADFTYTKAQITTSTGGTRSLQFNTSHATGPQKYTITVVDPANTTRSNDVVVTVKPGSVTLTPSGVGVYYIGEEITLSGTNTDSAATYLFLTGSNLAANGVGLSDITAPVEDGNLTTFTSTGVEADDTWSYRWNTAETGRPLDSGGYIIYAVSAPRNKANLSDARYATYAIVARVPILFAGPSDVVLTPGDEYRITGAATGHPDCVYTWILGENYRQLSPVSVDSNGFFEYTISPDETGTLAPGKYFVVIQHPMMNRKQDVTYSTTHPMTGEPGWWLVTPGMTPVDLGGLQPSDAVTALVDALDSPDVDDIYTRLTFEVVDSTLLVNFTVNITAGVAPLMVQFTDTSIRGPTAWSWDFGDGSTSTEQHPVHIYTFPDNYTVTLSLGNGETCTKPGYIKVTPVLFGDANEDGEVNQADTLIVLQEVVGMREQPTPGTDRFRKTDVHANGVIEVGDALFIAQYNVGLRDVWFAAF